MVATDKKSSTETILHAQGIKRVFVDGQRRLEVLKGASLDLSPGEIVALVGRSGCGKSTLLHILGLLDQTDGGTISINGQDIDQLSESAKAKLRNQYLGFVFQHYFLPPEFSVLENVVMAARIGTSISSWFSQKSQWEDRASDLLNQVGLGDRLDQKPTTLSGGERQRTALARAMLLKPKLLLCDEPTGNLDPETGARIMELLCELSRREQTAVLVVTHEQSLTQRADRVLRLYEGRLHEENG